MYKIAVAGTGSVGLVAGVCLAQVGHQVVCVDVDETKINQLKAGISPIYEAQLEELLRENIAAGKMEFTIDYRSAYKNADVIFIGVGTPELPNGSADLTNITTVASQIAESVQQDCLVVVKSTVPVGTNDRVEELIWNGLVHKVRVEVASNPEFLAQGTAVRDTLHAERTIIGTESKWAEERLMEIYKPFQLPMVSVSRRSAEMIKYASNDFLALKISYMNEIANLCERVGADIEDVAKGMSFDSRIGGKFLRAGIGYGGSCFPKDTKALAYMARQHEYELRTVTAAIEVNNEQKTVLVRKAIERLGGFSGLKVAVLGLTFKPETDDVREAASLVNIPLLLEQGANVYAYDPVGVDNFSKWYPQGNKQTGSITYVSDAMKAIDEAHVCFILTEWKAIQEIKPEAYKRRMNTPLVYDGRNLYSVHEMEQVGVEYHSIGRRSTGRASSKETETIEVQTD
ncbi:UDP-glucose dehydrogenase family protein [Paenibacillus montanisoli]|uniref:UDP-glucose dehydrogenase family protein n=1 Tax=Paenibacillus montanisoli TaxID=2081970 RepID=UPI001F0CC72F|nr:UDP-glucose/GDP-mannose dehydrogenase family protein [Paenibacillus montanisoli]